MAATKPGSTPSHEMHKRYRRQFNAVGLTWAILTCCFCIINIIVFVEPQWIGDTEESIGTGYVGLYQLCELINSGTQLVCVGSFQDFSTILTRAFQASTFFIGVSILIIFLCIFFFWLFLFVKLYIVYYLCGSLQILSTIFMFLGCVIFPRGWDHLDVQRICGNDCGPYNIGQCMMRWSYILAIVGIFDIMILAILAFVLGTMEPWIEHDHIEAIKSKNESIAASLMLSGGQSVHGGVDAVDYHSPSVMMHYTSQPTLALQKRSGHYSSQPIYVVGAVGDGQSVISTRRRPVGARSDREVLITRSTDNLTGRGHRRGRRQSF